MVLEKLADCPEDLFNFHKAVKNVTPYYCDDTLINFLTRHRSKMDHNKFADFWFAYRLNSEKVDDLVNFFPWNDRAVYKLSLIHI